MEMRQRNPESLKTEFCSFSFDTCSKVEFSTYSRTMNWSASLFLNNRKIRSYAACTRHTIHREISELSMENNRFYFPSVPAIWCHTSSEIRAFANNFSTKCFIPDYPLMTLPGIIMQDASENLFTNIYIRSKHSKYLLIM
jgi:hypothetical protein